MAEEDKSPLDVAVDASKALKESIEINRTEERESITTEQTPKQKELLESGSIKSTNTKAYSETTDDENYDAIKSPDVMSEEQAATGGTIITDPVRPGTLEQMWNDRMLLSTGRGFKDEALTNALMGFNHRKTPTHLPIYKEIQSSIFFTRPDINLSEENIANSRFFSDLASMPESSVEYAVLAALDPQCPLTNPVKKYGFPCFQNIPFDNLHGFAPLLSTQCLQATGFPDQTLDVWMSEEGAFREQYGHVDSVYEVNNQFTLNVTFANDATQFVQLYIRGLLEYSSGVKGDIFKPKTYNQIRRSPDYQSRIYVYKYDPLGKRIINWGAAMVAWPVNDNEGSLLNYDKLINVSDSAKEINIQFQCIGARYRDPLLFETFNTTAAYCNPDLIPASLDGYPKFDYSDYSPMGGDSLVEIQEHQLQLFNWKGYPIVDPDTRNFRWFLPVGEFQRIRERGGF